MATVVIGIDPGITGALAGFVGGVLITVKDMPIITEDRPNKGAGIRDLIGGKHDHKRNSVDAAALAAMLRNWTADQQARIVREKVSTRPNQGIVSSGRFMAVVGMIDGIAASLGVPVQEISPTIWKRLTNTPADKAGACRHAAELFPSFAPQFKRISMDHNRAEAVLIGLYGVQHP